MAELAKTHGTKNKWKEAETLQEDIQSFRNFLRPEHQQTLSTMAALAKAYWYKSDLSNATVLERNVLEARVRILGSDHQVTISSRRNIAAMYASRNQYERAIELQKQVVDSRSRVVQSSFKNGKKPHADIGSDEELLQVYQQGLKRIRRKEHVNAQDGARMFEEVYSRIKHISPRFRIIPLSFLSHISLPHQPVAHCHVSLTHLPA